MICFILFTILSLVFIYLFLGNREHNPLFLMMAVWSLGIGIPRLHLSPLESPWPISFIILLGVSLMSFIAGFWFFDTIWKNHQWWAHIKVLATEHINTKRIRYVIYLIFVMSLVSLYLFFKKAGNFPLLAPDSDAFRFTADNAVPGLINYTAQFARLFIPLSFFVIFYEKFKLKKHWDLILMSIVGALALTLFASRTQIFFVDLWVMALFLIMRKPNLKDAAKFYPFFLIVSIVVLAAVPIIRDYKSYGTTNYLGNVTQIKQSNSKLDQAFIPIYVGISFNMQALLHAQNYYQTHPLQYGKVSLDPFTNLFGKVLPFLNHFKSNYDLGAIFYSWWNTGTYLFPFVQDFGSTAFFVAPFIIAGLIALVWQYWKSTPNFLSVNLYAYVCFFVVMTVYLSFTVRAEFYLDLMFLLLVHFYVSRNPKKS